MDFLAVASMGFYPTPTPTGAQRMASVATYGLFLGPLPAGVVGGGKGLMSFGFGFLFS